MDTRDASCTIVIASGSKIFNQVGSQVNQKRTEGLQVQLQKLIEVNINPRKIVVAIIKGGWWESILED